jgi:glutaminase
MPTHTANPLVNAGAIATTSLITGGSEDEKWNKILDFYGKAAGEKLTLIDEVYKSEAATNAGNKALSMLLAKYERIYSDPFTAVDIYTKQCSVGVNVVQLARMGATLANNGVNPTTGEQVIKAENVPYILSTMMMAGLYDGSGGWAWKVGLPAKSGVGGGIVAVVPGKGAIAVSRPGSMTPGNSVKAAARDRVCGAEARLQSVLAAIGRFETVSLVRIRLSRRLNGRLTGALLQCGVTRT